MLEQKELVLILLIVRATADEGEGLRGCARRGADPRENGEEGEGKSVFFPRHHSPLPLTCNIAQRLWGSGCHW